MKILKFGGTSVGSAENIKKVIAIVTDNQKNGKVAVIVSAFSKITDKLIEVGTLAASGNKKYLEIFDEIKTRHLKTAEELINENSSKTTGKIEETLRELENILEGIFLIKEISKRTLDLIMSFGERLSAYIISQSINADFLDSRKLIKTDENFGNAKVDFELTNKNIREYFDQHEKLQIITGYIGGTRKNDTSTLGRGGSDYSASIFGAALNAEVIEIWTDVDGIMTANPKQVKKAFPIKEISYVEAMEMSHFGAKVIYPPTMVPAMNKNIPIIIKNTLNPGFPGSTISKKSANDFSIKGISSISDIALLRLQGSGMIGVPGVSKRLFGSLSSKKINIILISQASSEHSICLAVEPKSATHAKETIEAEFEQEIKTKQIDPLIIEKDLSIIAVVGENMRLTPGIAGKVFGALGKNGINISAIAQGSSELNISTVISKIDENKALNAIHDDFFLSGTKTLNIFMVGCGQIGSTLIKQIFNQNEFLQKTQSLEIKLIGIANSKKMFFATDGLDLQNWKNELEKGESSDLAKFVEKMLKLNLPNSIFLDCTSNEEITKFYEKILKESVSIVTPNKKANSGHLKIYQELKETARKSNIKFFYETTVGAGLPVISTLRNLLYSGDKIIKIEAVLSGTLSYIFNSFTGEKSFSEIVQEAQIKGYTEPDPRDDLNGLDAARKILILGREIGLPLEMEDISVENLVPEDCRKISNLEEFFAKLSTHNVDYSNKLKAAQAEQKRLCYIAKIDAGKHGQASVKLQTVDKNHPFNALSGSDNIISFTTNRYLERPLVIKGPGAGAEVTAAGVFADVIRIANYLN
ncbi:bifunctional aspartate kinase/homoserine dehydrogenase I [Candidatus Peregrinibacteria bacterium]|nr:bifunctional aspartate kinase/homoserine dehydrogenase I [Candidatus Peregrinibacteria bacterium]